MRKLRLGLTRTALVCEAQGRGRAGRSGAVLIWFAILLVLLLGMVGLVIDAGVLMAAHRQAQNAADAAALAAANAMLRGKGELKARADADYFAKQEGIDTTASDFNVTVNMPPSNEYTSYYAGDLNYVEVIVTNPVQTFFIQVLGVARDQLVRGRAVAGFEARAAGEGVCVLDPRRKGLTVTGLSTLRVNGLVVVNSEGRGVDENYQPVGIDSTYNAASANQNSPAYAKEFHIVGGVNQTDVPYFINYDYPDDTSNVLHCGLSPVPDPLINLKIPTTALGVDPTLRPSPFSGGANNQDVDKSTSGVDIVDAYGANRVENVGTPEQRMILHPGIYESIEITGGKVVFVPGIYVLAPRQNVTNSLKITGGTIIAEGIMFYNTGDSYRPDTGRPDTGDGEQLPPGGKPSELGDDPPTTYWGEFQINAGMVFKPIDTEKYQYPQQYNGAPNIPVSNEFDGMLFFQRRRNNSRLVITGDAGEGNLAGTLYAKWAEVSIEGSGTYDAQFVVGSMKIAGGGEVIIDYTGRKLGKAPAVFLVE